MADSTRRGVAALLVVGMLLSVVLAAFVSFYASSSPDGLESVAQETGFADSAADSAVADSPVADYAFAGVAEPRWSVALAGLAGVAATAVVAFILFRLLAAGRRDGVGAESATDGTGTDPTGLG